LVNKQMERSIGIDWIRIAVVFMLFPFHTARVFDRWEPFYVKDTSNEFSTWLVGSLGFWFMSLLFVTAGYSAYHALKKRGANEYAKERMKKLLIPLIFGLVLIVPIQGYIALLQFNQSAESYGSFLKDYFINFEDLSGYTGGFTPAHLWFILFLLVISLILLPIMKGLLKKEYQSSDVKEIYILFGFVAMTVADCLPDIGGKNPFLYGLLFLFGFILAQRPNLMDFLRKAYKIILPVGVILIPVYMIEVSDIDWTEASILLRLSADLLKNICAWWMIIGLIGFTDRTFHRTSRPLRYLGAASYPVYILHQSVLVVVAYFIVQLDAFPWLKFMGIMLTSLILSLLLYELFRRIRITRVILGMK
jgi:glucans biosynthesis protein C